MASSFRPPRSIPLGHPCYRHPPMRSANLLLALVVTLPVTAQAQAFRDDCGLEPPGRMVWPTIPGKAYEPRAFAGEPPAVGREVASPDSESGVRSLSGLPQNHLARGALSG